MTNFLLFALTCVVAYLGWAFIVNHPTTMTARRQKHIDRLTKQADDQYAEVHRNAEEELQFIHRQVKEKVDTDLYSKDYLNQMKDDLKWLEQVRRDSIVARAKTERS